MTRPAQDTPLADQAEYWVVRLASGEIEAAELADFKVWQAASPDHRAAFDRERALWQSLEGQQQAFENALPVSRSSNRPRLRRWTRIATPRRALAAAAVAAVLAVMAPGVALRLQADQIAPTGEIRTLALPDGSTAMLDSDAAIAIRFGSSERRIELLRGQAWFDVKHGDDRPFRVAALGGVTQDVGTAFEVSRAEDIISVAVTQGAVEVSSPQSAQAVALSALDRAQYAKGGPVRRMPRATADGIATWRRGLIVIDAQPVETAIAEVARYRPGYTFVWADTATQPKISGVFRTEAPDEALQTMAHMAGLRIVTLPGGVAILRR